MAEVDFQTEYGPVGIALSRVDEYGRQEVDRTQEFINTGLSLAESLTVIRPVAEAVLANVRALADKAESVSAEFGLELGAKGRFIVAEANATASIKVTLTWKP